MVRVIARGRFRVYVDVETGERHHIPHCHVYWPDGDCAVDLRELRVIAGEDLPSEARGLLEEFKRDLWRAWFRLNGVGGRRDER